MEMLDLSGKVHDEQRQGEAFLPATAIEKTYQKHFYIESYGCAMNFSDSEVVASILQANGFGPTSLFEEADLVHLEWLDPATVRAR